MSVHSSVAELDISLLRSIVNQHALHWSTRCSLGHTQCWLTVKQRSWRYDSSVATQLLTLTRLLTRYHLPTTHIHYMLTYTKKTKRYQLFQHS